MQPFKLFSSYQPLIHANMVVYKTERATCLQRTDNFSQFYPLRNTYNYF